MFNEEYESKISSTISVSESQAFGRPIRRVYVGLNFSQNEDQLLSHLQINEENEVVFLKFDSSKTWIRRLLTNVDLNLVTSPETIYWKRPAGLEVARGAKYALTDSQEIVDGDHIDSREVERVVREIFASYQNHYSSNPLLDNVSVEDAYVDWALNNKQSQSKSKTKVLLEDQNPIGIALIEEHEHGFDFQLAGIVQKAEGTGTYGAFLNSICNGSDLDAFISTQTSNIRVQRSWIKIGFSPFKSFSTIHLLQ